mmetsp:Transcript_113521/g.367279  ORF Transcript_113521/g.367279 Transcript_113521/m.367279 type:complete len:122 (+) Transcript_113521:281-646(+)
MEQMADIYRRSASSQRHEQKNAESIVRTRMASVAASLAENESLAPGRLFGWLADSQWRSQRVCCGVDQLAEIHGGSAASHRQHSESIVRSHMANLATALAELDGLAPGRLVGGLAALQWRS